MRLPAKLPPLVLQQPAAQSTGWSGTDKRRGLGRRAWRRLLQGQAWTRRNSTASVLHECMHVVSCSSSLGSFFERSPFDHLNTACWTRGDSGAEAPTLIF